MKDQYRYVNDPKYRIIRYRCYACASPDWEPHEDVKAIDNPGHYTIVALCDACEKRFYKEGPFWSKHNG